MTDDELFADFFEWVAQVAHERFGLAIEPSPRGKYSIQWCDGEFRFEVFDLDLAGQPGGLDKLKTQPIDQITATTPIFRS